MITDLSSPDLDVSLRLDTFAPRAARHHVSLIDRPSPDLRDAVRLLTSELVSRAVQRCAGPRQDVLQLRVWMPQDVVRVELHGARELMDWPEHDDGTLYELMLLNQLADRWAVDSGEPAACAWFEIDRHRVNRDGAI